MIEKQYIDIFKQYRDVIDSKSVAGINSLRDRAFDSFQKLGFPTKSLEDYKYIDVAEKFSANYGLNLNRVPLKGNPYNSFKCNIPTLSSNLFFMMNDMFYGDKIPEVDIPKGVFVGGLMEFYNLYPEIFKEYYGQITHIEESGLAAFNTMFAQDGFVVYVPKNVVVEKPIQVINLLKANQDYLINRRVLIIVEENAQVKILACDHTMDDTNFLLNQVVEIYAKKNAIVDFYELEENSDKVVRLSSTFVKQEEDSDVLTNSITLKGGVTRNNFHVTLGGEHCQSYVCGMVIADGYQFVDNLSFLDHSVPNCQSTQLFKYILLDKAVGSFCGRIHVAKDAQKTLAYQTNNNLCISPDSRMYSKPQLEIYADDVKCSHGLTTGQLDEGALFYMRARGIKEQDAKLMLMQAFAADVLDHVRIPELKLRLVELVEQRLQGKEARCGDCAMCK